jgi:DNA-binding NarL/FixJ family response regulator
MTRLIARASLKNGSFAISAIYLVRTTQIDVLVLDLSMPGQSGVDALAMVRVKSPGVGILILSGYPGELYALNRILLGASGTSTRNAI